MLLSNSIYAQENLINVNPNRQVAIHGYDPVAYFKAGKAVEGKAGFKHDHKNVTWQVSSQENLNLFTKEPDKYIPQYGGFCAYAASQPAKADVDPIAWRIIDNKLYLNYNLRGQRVWASNQDDHIKAADRYWTELQK